MRYVLLLLLFNQAVFALEETNLESEPPPNILFCLADDWGWPHAGAYGDEGIKTPSFDRLANEGVLFHHAYVSSPSCTPSRNAFITGKYHWQLGPGANLWSTLPVQHQSFIHLLRDNGYVTGRTKAKTWGPGNPDSWIKHHGAHPATDAYKTFAEFLENADAKNKPFFFWLGTSDPHRGYKKGSGKESGIDPDKVHLFKHYPDSDVVRNDVADYYYEVQRWDTHVGSAIAELEKNGLLDNTIIIMTGDHGMPFPRCKTNLYDSGVRVPFAVRWGKKINAGRKIEDFISFADIAPSLLEITGTAIPPEMTGRSFADLLNSPKSGRLDPEKRPDIVFGRERHSLAQEKPNAGGYPMRGLRNTEFLYIRNYRPNLWPSGTGKLGHTNMPKQWYSDCDGGPTKNYIFLNREKDEQHRRAFELCFAKRPSEELYDLKKDPDQIHNLAVNPAYSETLKTMRLRLQQRLSDLEDPRAKDPNYDEFDKHPYLGGGGGKFPEELMKKQNLSFQKTDHSIALIKNDQVVWQFNYNPEKAKPYFHPVALCDGTVLTEAQPADHLWHHALWFSWKFIDGVNFWKEDRQTGQSDGKTRWKNVNAVTGKDHSATITMELVYNPRGQKPILTEKRSMAVSPPDADGTYYIDWTSEFKACSDVDVTFDRTPLAGEPGGQPWGGYAGLSVRLNGKGSQWTVSTEKASVKWDGGTFRGKAKAMDYSGVFNERPAGIAILDHPGNLNAPSPWYAINNNPMKYFSPAVICYKPHKLSAGQMFTLRYRIIVHPQKWDVGKLKTQIDEYCPIQDKHKERVNP